MMLSTKAKEAIKTALAMTIAYGIALSMDWDKPMWAGFAVAFISLATVGQSLNKGAMRMMGTLLAVVASLTILGLFPQDRWAFMVAISLFVGFCTYLMGGAQRQYFWNVAGFVTVIICLEAGGSAEGGFEIAVLRAQESGLGILVYSLVAVLLWPSNTREDLDKAERNLAATQHGLYQSYRKLARGDASQQASAPLRMQEIQQFTQFSQALTAAQTDTYDVHEVRHQWRLVKDQRKDLMETLERWRESMGEIKGLDLPSLIPNLPAAGEEVEHRFGQIGRMLEGKAPQVLPSAVDLPLNQQAAHALSHFETAALAVARTQMLRIEALTRDLFATVADIKGFETGDAPVRQKVHAKPVLPVLDADRIAAALRVMVTLWLAYLLWIYTEIPGGVGFVIMAGSLGMALSSMPQLPVTVLFVPAAVSVLFASILYIFVMPLLSSFVGLGLLIFAVTFAICYLFAAPRQVLGRAFGLSMFVSIAGISNEQTYSFLSVANTALMFPLIFTLMAITAYIPVSTRPATAYRRLIGRFFRSCEYLTSTMRWDPARAPSLLDRWREAFHQQEVETLPGKLTTWARAIDTRALPGTTPQQVHALTTSLQALTYRMQELLEARQSPQADLLVHELLADVRAWRLEVQGTFQGFRADPAASPADGLRERLNKILDHLEQRVEEALDKAGDGELTNRDGENFYRLLGAYRGLSEATIAYAATAGDIDWSPWREARF